MMKCDVKVQGIVCRAATTRVSDFDGRQFVTLGVKVSLADKQGAVTDVVLNVKMDALPAGMTCADLGVGRRVALQGTMTARNSGEQLWLNLNAVSVEPVDDVNEQIDGEMEFRGTVGKNIEVKSGKNGHKYVLFSAWSAEKVKNSFSYTWVRMVKFGVEEELQWLVPKTKIEVSGALQLQVWNGRLQLSCRVAELKQHVVECPF